VRPLVPIGLRLAATEKMISTQFVPSVSFLFFR
jgi:hypothetical protein